MRRREFVALSMALSSFAPFAGGSSEPRPSVRNSPKMPAPANSLGVKALVFDVFGTVVDWRGSIIREGEQWSREKNLQIDWGTFADRWRAGYGPSMEKVRKGEFPWTKLDVLHRIILDQLLVEFKITGLTEEEKEHWTNVWHRLTPWPDSVEGLTRLKKNFIIATLSNGNVSLLVEMAKYAGLPWDTVFSAELFHHYKPDREVYLGAVELLSCKPAEVMMVAAHPLDLKAAQSCGLKAGYVPRPLERGPNPPPPPAGASSSAANSFDVVATDFIDLGAKLS
jgi:2-haloacid dehalogenase